MHPKVETFLKQRKEEEKTVELEKRNKLFRKLGLYNEKEVSYSEGYDRVVWAGNKPVYYKWEMIEVSDEEYNEILKYAKVDLAVQSETSKKKQFEIEDNGENYIMKFAKVWLILLIICAVCMFIAGIVAGNTLFGFNWLMFLCYVFGCAMAIILGFFTYFIVKVYTNISRKSSAIYQLLINQQ